MRGDARPTSRGRRAQPIRARRATPRSREGVPTPIRTTCCRPGAPCSRERQPLLPRRTAEVRRWQPGTAVTSSRRARHWREVAPVEPVPKLMAHALKCRDSIFGRPLVGGAACVHHLLLIGMSGLRQERADQRALFAACDCSSGIQGTQRWVNAARTFHGRRAHLRSSRTPTSPSHQALLSGVRRLAPRHDGAPECSAIEPPSAGQRWNGPWRPA